MIQAGQYGSPGQAGSREVASGPTVDKWHSKLETSEMTLNKFRPATAIALLLFLGGTLGTLQAEPTTDEDVNDTDDLLNQFDPCFIRVKPRPNFFCVILCFS